MNMFITIRTNTYFLPMINIHPAVGSDQKEATIQFDSNAHLSLLGYHNFLQQMPSW